MEKIEYVVVGDNNFWYTKTQPLTKEEFDSEIKNLIEEIKSGTYSDQPNMPEQIFAYPLQVKMQKISIDILNTTSN